ncbi:hypothetical protein SB724_19990, partial [Bacillus sp. SIMBA_031]|uniref:hypothetical protein n=1 Tax=Bacillus sp. SIMBA_031 TaxID=3085774 RepID=UPI0039799CC9
RYAGVWLAIAWIIALASHTGAFLPCLFLTVNHCCDAFYVLARSRSSRASELTSRPPSIRWQGASLILHARCADILTGNMPHLEKRLRQQPG